MKKRKKKRFRLKSNIAKSLRSPNSPYKHKVIADKREKAKEKFDNSWDVT